MKIGLIGLDTGHATMYAERFNDPAHTDYVEGGKVVAGYTGESKDFPFSYQSAEKVVPILRDRYDIAILPSPEDVVEASDAIIISGADGRAHKSQFASVAGFGKPVFIDKFLCLTSEDAREIIRTAEESKTPLFSASPWRYAAPLVAALGDSSLGEIVGADFPAPLPEEYAHPGFLWWGTHLAEPLYAALGPGCVEVHTVGNKGHLQATGLWKDGRIGTIRGCPYESNARYAVIHREKAAQWVETSAERFHARHHLAKAVLQFFRTRQPLVDLSETAEAVRFVEAAEESRTTGKTVRL